MISETPRLNPPQLTLKGLGATAIIGLAYSVLYALVLANTGNISVSGIFFNTAVRFSTKFLILLGCWWFVFRVLHNYNFWVKIASHAILASIYAFLWFYSYSIAYVLYIGVNLSRAETFIGIPYWIALTALFEYLIVFSVLHMFYSSQQLREQERQASELEKLATEQQISNLKAQLNPHFMFNTLNSINAMGGLNLEESRNMVSKLSDMLRYSMKSFDEEWVPLKDEVIFIRKYLELEKYRFCKRLEYEIIVDKKLEQFEVSPLSIQPIVENAVRHGIAPIAQGGRVTLSIKKHGEHIHVEVDDTGAGLPDDFNPKSDFGIGLGNTNTYLQTKYGEEYGIRIEQKQLCGTTVSFKIPIIDM